MIDSFINQIRPYDYVSFDVFDTLMFRSVLKPYDQLALIPIMVKNRHGIELSKSFMRNRCYAEKSARREKNGQEVSLKMIYDKMPLSDDFKSKVMKAECDIEVDNCIPNQIMIDVLNRCRDMGKTIVITTDMYLPRSCFECIMQKLGVVYDYLFISCEEGETKRTGRLFPIVLDKLGINPNQIIHIGDDPNNDIVQAEKNGIKALLRLKKADVNPLYFPYKLKTIEAQHLYSFLSKGLENGDGTPEFRIGYNVIGPLMWDFCNWIHNKKMESNLDKLLFVAREGFLIMKCYQQLFPEDSVEYIRLNKNLLRLPSLYTGNPTECFLRSIPLHNNFYWENIFGYLRIKNLDKIKDILIEKFPNIDFNKQISISDLRNHIYDDIVLFLINSQAEDIKLQAQLLDKYLLSLGLYDNKVGLVNNSLNGSGQSLLEEYCNKSGKKINIVGLQFSRSKRCVQLLGDRCKAMFDEYRIPHKDVFLFTSNCLIIEHLLFEPQGTALQFAQDEEGKISVICDSPRKETLNFKTINDIQRSAMKYISDVKQNIECTHIYSVPILKRFLMEPNVLDAQLISTLWDDDIEGDTQILNLDIKIPVSDLINCKASINWIYAYIAYNSYPTIYKYLIRYRSLLRYYKHNKDFLLSDLSNIKN